MDDNDNITPIDRGRLYRRLPTIPQEEIDIESRMRIKKWMKWCMIGVAAFIDIIEILLALVVAGDVGGDSILSVAADALFVTWFLMLGVSFTKKPGMLWGWVGGAIIEFIPVLDAIVPAFTIAVVLTIRQTRKEDMDAIIMEMQETAAYNNINIVDEAA